MKKGFTIIELLVVIAGILLLIPLMNVWAEKEQNVRDEISVANHMLEVNKALNSYVAKNFDVILADTLSNKKTVTVSDLIADGHLNTGFSLTNIYNQDYVAYIRQPKKDKLEMFLFTTGGNYLDDPKFLNITIPSIASRLGSGGGFIPSGLLSHSSDILQGANNAYKITIDSDINPGAGHIAIYSSSESFSSGAKDFLYRFAVAGQPELNQMQTELDMTEHAITNVGEMTMHDKNLVAMLPADISNLCTADKDGRLFYDKTDGLYLCRDSTLVSIADTKNSLQVKGLLVADNSSLISKPICPIATGTSAKIFLSPSTFAQGDIATPILAIRTWADDLGDNWQIHLQILTSRNTWITPPPNFAKIFVMASCE